MKDHCTFFIEGSWNHCCKAHDIAYETQVPKSEADIALFKCVADSGHVVPSFLTAVLMFCAVSLFGYKFYKQK